jgi:hypothetical protein
MPSPLPVALIAVCLSFCISASLSFMLTGASDVEYTDWMRFLSGFETSMSEARFRGTQRRSFEAIVRPLRPLTLSEGSGNKKKRLDDFGVRVNCYRLPLPWSGV